MRRQAVENFEALGLELGGGESLNVWHGITMVNPVIHIGHTVKARARASPRH